jgi:peptidoglycan/LPS O-acetylase OafA/YrhL
MTITETSAPGTGSRRFGDGPMGHIPALDGIRGVAVLAVIAHHLDHLTGGYLGVDAFFVLSGFLITGLLVDEVRFGSGLDRRRPIDLGRFWVRRVKRLFPALALLVVVVVVVESWVISDDGPTLRREVLSALLYVYNWNALAEGIDYWSSFASPSPLRHMWSRSRSSSTCSGPSSCSQWSCSCGGRPRIR